MNSKGFTVIELAFVIMVSGLLMITAFTIYNSYQKQGDIRTTIDNLRLNEQALARFYSSYNFYPCPADPALPPGDPLYGVAQCRVLPTDPCLVQECPIKTGSDVDNDGNDDAVLVGIVPFVTLYDFIKVQTNAGSRSKMPYYATTSLDAFKNRIAYAVSETMADEAPTYSVVGSVITPVIAPNGVVPKNPKWGIIEINDANGNSMLEPPGSAHFVVFSLGDNGFGAHTATGDLVESCEMLDAFGNPIALPGFNNTSLAGMRLERENCDNSDEVFVQEIRSIADTNSYFDDILIIGMSQINNIWTTNTTGGLYNTNAGNIAVGPNLTDGSQALHVNGDPAATPAPIPGNIRAETQMQAQNGFCSKDTADPGCLDPRFIATSGVLPTADQNCPAGEVAYAIENNRLLCKSILPPGLMDLPTCPTGEFLRGINIRVDGSFTAICNVPP